MHNKQFYPSYIPGKWIHYAHHKKNRIRKKYLNQIRREVQRHKVDAQMLSFLLADAATKYSGRIGCNQPEISRFSQLGGSWCSGSAAGLFALTLPQIAVPSLPRLALPQITAPAIEIPEIPETTRDALEKLGKAFEELKDAVLEAIQPIVDYLVKIIKKFFKWAGDFWDHLWCENKRWWYMAEHHKKRRIRKKYRNKIKREATRRVGELLELLATDDSENDEDGQRRRGGTIAMKWPYECEKCGAVLDAGECCDCESSQSDEGRRQDDETEARAKQNSDLPAMR